MDEGGGLWAVGGESSDDLSNVDWGGAVVLGGGTSDEGGRGSGDGETHLEFGIKGLRGVKLVDCLVVRRG